MLNFEIIDSIEQLQSDLQTIKESFVLLEFFEKYPEIESITVTGIRQSSHYVSPLLTNIEFKISGQINLLKRLDLLEEYEHFAEIDDSDWNEILFGEEDLKIDLDPGETRMYLNIYNLAKSPTNAYLDKIYTSINKFLVFLTHMR